VLCRQSSNDFVIIDYQDMCIGPKYYDLASLVFDPYIILRPEQLNSILNYYFKHYVVTQSYDDFIHDLNLVGLQRLLKAAGRYARLKYLHDKDTYMQFFYPAIKKVKELLKSTMMFPTLRNFEL